MGRVEETDKALSELANTLANSIDDTTNVKATTAILITAQCSVNTEIAKSLALLADDIHFIKEILAKGAES